MYVHKARYKYTCVSGNPLGDDHDSVIRKYPMQLCQAVEWRGNVYGAGNGTKRNCYWMLYFSSYSNWISLMEFGRGNVLFALIYYNRLILDLRKEDNKGTL